jgi:hypothetical protein
MGKVFGILFMVLAIWVGIEIYTKGSDRAFGGALAWLGGESASADGGDGRSTMQRFGDRVRSDMQTGAERTSGQIPETELDEGDVMSGDADDLEE